MFDAAQQEKQSGSKMWVGLFVVVAVIAVGALLYTMSTNGAKDSSAPKVAAAAAPITDADPVKDLKVLRALMDKDHAGTTAVWLVTIENRSKKYAYSDIKYETTYVGGDNTSLQVNNGTIASTTVAPGDQTKSELKDGYYPNGTAWFKFKITGATPSLP